MTVDKLEYTDGVDAKVTFERLAGAIAYALDIHPAQCRKGLETPYIGRLLSVAGLVLEHGGDEEQAIAAVLYDAMEDQSGEKEAIIAAMFGVRVATIARACANTAHFFDESGPDVLLVSCANKLHNARAILAELKTHGIAVFDRFIGGLDGTLWYYRMLDGVFSRRMPGALSRDLAATVTELERTAYAVQCVPLMDPKS
jgi:(p)ppGpp synthase/HD superfamily hydrolase